MLWAISRLAAPNFAENREKHLPPHVDYLRSQKNILVISGATTSDDGKQYVGSLLIVAGMAMGIGTAAFNFVANSRKIDASISIPIVDTAMLVVSVIGAVIFFAEPVTIRKLVGIGLLIAGIVVLKPE